MIFVLSGVCTTLQSIARSDPGLPGPAHIQAIQEMLEMLPSAPSPAQCKRWEGAKPQLSGLTMGGGQAGCPSALWVSSKLLSWAFCAPPSLPRPFFGRQKRTWAQDTQPEVAVVVGKIPQS